MSRGKRHKKLHWKRKPKPKPQFSSKTRTTRYKMWLRQGYRCGICQRYIRYRELYTMKVNIDHIRPKAHGGSGFPRNLQLTHQPCNTRKADACSGCPVCKEWE